MPRDKNTTSLGQGSPRRTTRLDQREVYARQHVGGLTRKDQTEEGEAATEEMVHQEPEETKDVSVTASDEGESDSSDDEEVFEEKPSKPEPVLPPQTPEVSSQFGVGEVVMANVVTEEELMQLNTPTPVPVQKKRRGRATSTTTKASKASKAATPKTVAVRVSKTK